MLFFVLVSTMLLFSSCSESVVDPPVETGVDTTTYCKTVTEVGAYSTFYKPQSGYVGDPMPYYNSDDGLIYLFFLQDWRNGASVDHPIYRIKTNDFSSFFEFAQAIPNGEAGSQETWLGTGSFIKDNGGKLYGFYTGHNSNLYPAEKVMLATSTDMRTFTKQANATFEAPNGYDKNNFRDPFVYFDSSKSKYVMLVSSIKDNKAVLARYTSEDLNSWDLISPLTDFESDAHILECPNMLQIGDKWYLFFSRINRDEHRKTFYRVADSPDGPWLQCKDALGHHETFDGLYFYAAKTVEKEGQVYISGWCSTGQELNGSNELDWAGSLITHKLVQQPSGKLYPTIPDAVDNKFDTDVDFEKIKSKGDVIGDEGSYSISSTDSRSYALFNRNTTPVKISMSIDASNSNSFGFSFGACDNMSEIYSVSFDLTASNRWSMPALFLNKETSYSTGDYSKELNFTPLIVPENKVFDVKIVIEKSVCVVYVNNNVAFTNRIYKMDKNPWSIYVDDGSIDISNMSVKK